MAGRFSPLSEELDTICAISSPQGEGAISIIRSSGKESSGILKKIFKPYKNGTIPASAAAEACARAAFEHRRVYTGRLYDPSSGSFVDEANAVFFKAPGTFTGEDMFEIYPHGGIFNTRYILEIILKSGARLAYNGEFTKRAYLNGKINMLQAEAILGIIKSNSVHNLLIANNQLGGFLEKRIGRIKDDFLYLLAVAEALIDFSDEEFEGIELKFSEKAEDLVRTLAALADSYAGFAKFDGGVSVVIAGMPNVGKSSLMNALLQKKRAIVSDVPGTTRDYIEESIFLFNKRLKIVDTAGIRKSADSIEGEGISMSYEQIKAADLAICVFDPRQDTAEGGFDLCPFKDKNTIFVLNKVDLLPEAEIKRFTEKLGALTGVEAEDIIPVSAAEETGMELLRSALYDRILKMESVSREETGITTLRQKILVEKSLETLKSAAAKFKNREPLEIVSIDLREAACCLDEITGAVSNEDVLDTLFREFCIGK